MHIDGLEHETPFRIAPLFGFLGVGTIVHAVPSQDSTSGCGTSPPSEVSKTSVSPTAVHRDALVQEMERRIAPPPR